MTDKKKVYGLILPKKGGPDKTKGVFNVFGDDQDSDEEQDRKGPVGPFGNTKTNTKLKKQSQMDIEKALMEDPSVYEYDEIYDDIQASRPQAAKQEETKSKKNKKPVYIAGLLKAAEVKKKEDERRNERKVQKEREEEGEKYADKESFVTSAYKHKMLAMQEEAEEEKRKEQLEALTDVTKQKDLGGFYRYLYRQTTGSTEGDQDASKNTQHRVKEEPLDDHDIKEEPLDDHDVNVKKKSNRRKHTSSSSSSSSSTSDTSKSKTMESQFSKARQRPDHQRSFRKRRSSSSTDDNDDVDEDKKRGKNDRLASQERELSLRRSNRKSLSPEDRKKVENAKRKMEIRSKSSSSPEDRKRKGRRRSPGRKGEGQNRRSLSRSKSPSQKTRKRSGSRSRDGSPLAKGESLESDGRDSKTKGQDVDRSRKEGICLSRDTPSTEGDEGPGVMPTVGKVKVTSNKTSAPVDPRKKVYPHHNSPKEIEEARKRYLIRKLERENTRGS